MPKLMARLRSRRAAGGAPLSPSAVLAGALRALGYRGPLARPWLRLGSVALAVALALALAATGYAAVRALFPAPAAALAPATGFELEGPIEAISEASMTIAGITVDVGPGTTIEGTPALGAVARATGQIRPDGTLLADAISVQAAEAIPTAAPTEPAAPTEAPAAVATAAPPTAEPAPPTAEPAPPAAVEPLARLRQLIEAGRADGRAGREGDALLERLGAAEEAFAEGNGQRAGSRLRDLYRRLSELAREGRIEAGFAQEALGLLWEIEAAYGVRAVPGDERGDDDDRGEGGGGGGRDDDDDGDD